MGALLPAGLRGLVVAGLLAALMSSLSSVFNSCSTLVTFDIYRKINPGASEKKLVLVGQITTLLLVLVAFLWIPFMKKISGQLYQYLQSVQAYISPPDRRGVPAGTVLVAGQCAGRDGGPVGRVRAGCGAAGAGAERGFA